jgi:DNA repair exonuclease SbcCD nuclease subunit
MVRFLHTSDWQLGMTRHFLDAEEQGRFSQARIDAIRTLGRIAAERSCAFVVVAGDVFETNQVGPRTLARTLDALAEVPVPVFLLPGNHDPLDAGSVFRRPAFVDRLPAQVRILDDTRPRAVPGLERVEVLGAPWFGKKPLEDLCAKAIAEAPAPAAGTLRIVVGHGAVDALDPDRDNLAAIRLAALEEALADGRCHYVALGDRHSATEVGGAGAVRYSGAPEPTDFDEDPQGIALLVDLEPDRPPAVEAIRVGSWRFVGLSAELDGRAAVEAFAASLRALPDKDRTVVRLALSGSLSVAESASLDAVLDAQREVFASLERWQRHDRIVTRPDELDVEGLGLSGYQREVWDELAQAAAGAGTAAETARDALVLLHRLAHDEGLAAAEVRP